MKNLLKLIILLSLITTLGGCKKTYSCKAKDVGAEFVFKCDNCKKDDVEAYKKEIEEKGYTDVSCEK